MVNEKYSLENEESERLLYRKVTQSDFGTWLTFCNDSDSLKYIFSQNDSSKSSEEKCKIWFDKVFNRYATGLGGMNALIDKTSNEFVGQCGLLIQTIDDIEELEIGYSLMPSARKKGYAIEAAKKCRDFAFENNYRDSLISIIHPDNKASQKVALSNGMQLEKESMMNGRLAFIFRIRKSDWIKMKLNTK